MTYSEEENGFSLYDEGMESGETSSFEAFRLDMRSLRRLSQEGPTRTPRLRRGVRPYASAFVSPVLELPQHLGNNLQENNGDLHTTTTYSSLAASEFEDAYENIQRYYLHVTDYYAIEHKFADGTWGWRQVKEEVTEDVLRQHLNGDITIGLYSTRYSDSTVRWLCFDLDTLDATAVYRLAGELQVPYVVEDTGGRGRHIWQFFDEPISAKSARSFGLLKAEASGVKEVEVYPKQDLLENNFVGNLVRLPGGISRKTGRRSRVLYGDYGFASLPTTVNGSQAFQQPPEWPNGDNWVEALYAGETPEGRNNTLNKLAYFLLRKGFPWEVVEYTVVDCNSRLPEPLSDDELQRTILRRHRKG